jgi:hypothetical protein
MMSKGAGDDKGRNKSYITSNYLSIHRMCRFKMIDIVAKKNYIKK